MTEGANGTVEGNPSGNARIVTLSGRDVDDLKRLLSLLSNDAAAFERADVSRKRLVERAREIFVNRRRRIRIFGRAMFDEAAWEILLLLYITEGGTRQTLSSIAQDSGLSKSTAVRWVEYLDQRGLITREPHPTDKRSAFLALSDLGRTSLDSYLSETLTNGS